MLTKERFAELRTYSEIGGEFPGLDEMVKQGLVVQIQATGDACAEVLGAYSVAVYNPDMDVRAYDDSPAEAWRNILGMLAEGDTHGTAMRGGRKL